MVREGDQGARRPGVSFVITNSTGEPGRPPRFIGFGMDGRLLDTFLTGLTGYGLWSVRICQDQFLDSTIDENYPAKDYHRVYVGEVVKVLDEVETYSPSTFTTTRLRRWASNS